MDVLNASVVSICPVYFDCRCRVIIVSPVAIVITIIVVSRHDTAHRAGAIAVTVTVVVAIVVVIARYAIAIIVDFVARRAVTQSEPKLGVKKTLWWSFIELTQYVSPLLHCEIGIGNNIFQMLREVIKEYIEQYAPGEKSFPTSIPTLQQIIADTAQQLNEWDDSPKGLALKAMKRAVATHNKRWWLAVASQDVSSLSLSSPVAPSPHIFPIKNKMSIKSRLVRRCHRRRWVIIVWPVAIIITIVVVSRRAAAHHVACYAVTIIVDFVARCTVAESEPKLGVKRHRGGPS